jgi:hypothetical protein
MFTNRITSHSFEPAPAAAPAVPAGFAVCQLAPATNPLALQLAAQQQAYEQAIISAREEALRITLGRLQISVN